MKNYICCRYFDVNIMLLMKKIIHTNRVEIMHKQAKISNVICLVVIKNYSCASCTSYILLLFESWTMNLLSGRDMFCSKNDIY